MYCTVMYCTSMYVKTDLDYLLGQNWGSLKAQASSKRGGRGGVAPHQLSMELTCGPFCQMMKYLTLSPVACPCHYRVTCILTDFEVVLMSMSCVFLACRVDSRHSLVRDHFRSHWLTRGRCPHDVTDRYLLMVTMDQSSCAVEGC